MRGDLHDDVDVSPRDGFAARELVPGETLSPLEGRVEGRVVWPVP
jgi:hypothetical protein